MARGDEARQVVDVAVRVVAGDAAAEPDHLRIAQVVGEHALDAVAAEPGVARLDVGEQALLGGEQRALGR